MLKAGYRSALLFVVALPVPPAVGRCAFDDVVRCAATTQVTP